MRIWCAVRLKQLSWVWEMASNWSGHEVDNVQEMSEVKDDEIDGETCSELCQDSDTDGSEFPGCKGRVDDLLIKLLSLCGVEKAW